MRKLLCVLLFMPMLAQAAPIQKMFDTAVLIHIRGKIKNGGGTVQRGTCSGTFIDETHVLTAAHCFEDEDKAWVKDYSGRCFSIQPMKIDFGADLALVQVLSQHPLHHAYAKLGRMPRLGATVWAVGCPFALPFILSTGIVGGGLQVKEFTSFYIVHMAMINPGSSGGGLFDTKGRLVGVNTMSIGFFGWSGISCAVSVDSIKVFLGVK